RSLTETFAAGSGSVTATTRLERVDVDAKSAASFGIIVNELVTNALKYGFRDNRSGTLHLDLAERDGIIEIAVSDDGAGLPADFDFSKGGGFGTQVVDLLAKQLGGTVEFERGERTVFRVKVKR
ncbi:MAG: histidine kinase, partial [Candidatus Melainabacteria bacterium HGW-Melainabacteria-1]